MVQQLVHAGAGVAAHQHPAPVLVGQLVKRGVHDGDLVSGVVGGRAALSKHGGQRLARALDAVVDEGQ